MLAAMMEAWTIWLLFVGLGIGVAGTWVLLVRLPRKEDDVSPYERRAEAGWIAGIIERHGGVAPESFVEEVLDLHQAYLRAQRPPAPPPYAPPPGGPPNAAPPPGHAPPPPGYAPPPLPPDAPPSGYAPPPAPPPTSR